MTSGKSLRVASITYDYYPFDVRVRRLAESAAGAGCDMDVICLRDTGESAYEIYNGVNIFRAPFSRGFGESLASNVIGWLRFALASGALVTRLHARKPYDVIVVHNMPDFLIFAALVPKALGAKVVLDVQDVTPELIAARASGRRRAALKWVAGVQERVSTWFADMVLTVGWPFEAKLLERSVPPRKLWSVLNSADPGIFPASSRFSAEDALRPVTAPHDDTAPFVVMYWGTVAQRNGLTTALRALALALPDAPNLRLDIMGVGRGDEMSRLHQLAEDLGITERVRYFDPVPSERIVDFITHGDAGIVPYREDGFADLVLPTKAYEMAWLRRPIIASNTVAIRSMFRPESIALCQPDDPSSFATALVDLYHHPEKRRAMVESASEDYEPYRWEMMSQRYTALLADLARSGGPFRVTEPLSSRA